MNSVYSGISNRFILRLAKAYLYQQIQLDLDIYVHAYNVYIYVKGEEWQF